MNEHIKKLKRLKGDVLRIEREIDALIKKAYPIGSEVWFTKGRADIKAEILHHGSDCVVVRNVSTKKVYRVDLFWLLGEG